MKKRHLIFLTTISLLAATAFAESPTEHNYELVRTSTTNALEYTLQLLLKSGIVPSKYKHIAAKKLNDAAVEAYAHHVLPSYQEELYPAEWRWHNYMEGLEYCISILRISVNYDENDYEENITRYKNLIMLNEEMIKSGYWDSDYYDPPEYLREYVRGMRNMGYETAVIGNKVYTKITLGDQCKNELKNTNDEYRQKIEECKRLSAQKKAEETAKKKAEQQAKNEAYWAEHAETKQKLESECASLETQLKQLQEQVAPYDSEVKEWKKKCETETPSVEEKKRLEEQISALNQQKSSLSLFKGKEKKALQAQIDELNSRLPTINESIKNEKNELNSLCDSKIKELEENANPLKNKIDAIEKRINEIKNELTMDR